MFSKVFGTRSQREVKRIMPLVEKIESLRPDMQKLSDEELRGKTREFKKRLEEMLYVTKAKKFGMTAIMGFLIGLIMVFFGNGYLTMVTGLVGGLLADVILKKADYKSAKSTVLSCGVFSIWVFGNFAPIFLNRESYMVMLTEGYGAEYAATLNTYMPMWIAPILLVACFVFGLVGGVIGKAICKKHFQRAGIA